MKGDSFMWRKIQMIHSALIKVEIPSIPFMKGSLSSLPSIGYDMSKNILHMGYKYVDVALFLISGYRSIY